MTDTLFDPATDVDRACPTCGARSLVDALHPVRCAYRKALADNVEAHAAEHGIPATPALDLFAHMCELRRDAEIAHRAVLQVVDLGWRPVVGSTPEWLWRKDPS